jgi:AP-2 complex subunit alpha
MHININIKYKYVHIYILNITFIGRFIGVKDANIRYLGLEAMTRLAKSDGPKRAQAHQDIVLESLRDGDVSVRRRALDLIFVLVDETNSEEVVGELVLSLASAQSVIKEDMVVKIAILAEKYSPGNKWYIDTMVSVILAAGDFVAEPVWHR